MPEEDLARSGGILCSGKMTEEDLSRDKLQSFVARSNGFAERQPWIISVPPNGTVDFLPRIDQKANKNTQIREQLHETLNYTLLLFLLTYRSTSSCGKRGRSSRNTRSTASKCGGPLGW